MSKNAGFLGCGSVHVSPYVNGAKSNAWFDFDECDKFEIKENVSEKTRKSKKCKTYGQLKSQIPIKEPVELSIAFSTMNKDNFATLFMSEAEDNTIAAGTFTETVKNVQKGRSVHLAVRNIDPATVSVKSADGTTTFAVGTDYTIENAKLGFIALPETSGIPAGDLLIAGDNAESKSVRMVGGSKYDRRYSVKFVGTNLDTDEPTLVIVHDVRLAPQSGVDFLADDFTMGELTGKPVLDSETNETYFVDTEIT